MSIRRFGVVSMGRNGTHALINWLGGHFRCLLEFGFVNRHGRLDTFGETSSKVTVSTYTSDLQNGINKEERKWVPIKDMKTILSDTQADAIVLSYVSINLNGFFNDPKEIDRLKLFCDLIGVDFSDNASNILAIRTPWNQYASLLECKFRIKLKRPKKFIANWMMYAKEYAGKTNYIPNKVLFNYDEWFKNIDYRKNLSSQLSLKFSDFGLNTIGVEGNGSSFDGFKYQGCAQNMNVLERWKYLQNFPNTEKYSSFKRVMGNKWLKKLSREIFGQNPPILI